MIELEQISKTFADAGREVHAVNNVSLTIRNGDVFGIIGFSGAGKSTLVRCINLLERPTEGSVRIDGKELTRMPAKELRQARRKIGMIFQHFNLMPSRTIFGNVAYPLKGSGLRKDQIAEKVRKLLDLVGIADKENAYPSQLSGGQKQRAAIARALANDPDILLCDEATSALDPQTTKAILKLLERLNRELGITLVVITHEMAVIKSICRRVAVMENGRVVEEGDVYDVFAHPRAAITRRFVASASALSKVDKLIEEGSALVKPAADEKLVRLTFHKDCVGEHVISTVSREFGVDINIVLANVEVIEDNPLGGMVALLGGGEKQVAAALHYLNENHVYTEVIADGSI